MKRMCGRKAMTAGAATLAALVLVCTAAPAQTAANPSDVLAPAERESFTFTFRSSPLSQFDTWTLNPSSSLELSAGSKWRFTLDLENRGIESVEFEGLRAGAFFDITPRMSLGGALSFSDDDDAITRSGSFDDVPEVKFESAFRF